MSDREHQGKKIRAYWDEQADAHGTSLHATMPDHYLRQIEIDSLLEHLTGGMRVLDAGCGNGYSTIRFAKERNIDITGIDFSPRMIEGAQKALDAASNLTGRVAFSVGDVLGLSAYPDWQEYFDVVTTGRCLINLSSLKDQVRALGEIHAVLKPGGVYLMCEHTKEGLRRLNEVRRTVGLSQIQNRWHNIYIEEAAFMPEAEKFFSVERCEHISSTYHLASKVIYARLAENAGQRPDYMHEINKISADIPPIGDFGSLKLFVLRKKA